MKLTCSVALFAIEFDKIVDTPDKGATITISVFYLFSDMFLIFWAMTSKIILVPKKVSSVPPTDKIPRSSSFV
jgi:hypothetical protein